MEILASLFLLLLFVWVPCGFFAAAIAGDKHHNSASWFFAGLLWGPIGLLAATGLSDRRQRRILRLMAELQGVTADQIIINPSNPIV